MSGQRISSSGPDRRLGAAMIPVPASGAMSWSSWGRIVGLPSNSNIPAPAPAATRDIGSRGVALSIQGGGIGLPSADFAIWNPGIYYQPEPPAGPDTASMATSSDNQMPVPAGTLSKRSGYGGYPPGVKPSIQVQGRGILGQKQVGWPITTPYYQWRKSLGG